MEQIQKVVYINLDKRKDRKEQIENELKMLQIPLSKIERFDAIEKNNGALGCSLSHISVLKCARENKWSNVLILEDDFCANVDANKWEEKLKNVFSDVSDYDVILFSYRLCRSTHCKNTSVDKTIEAQTTSGYLVHQKFYDTLIYNMEEGYSKLIQNPHQYGIFGLDQYWKRLQPSAKWFHIVPPLGKQRGSYSDIENIFVDYGV